jgi:hypothetical protein
LNPCKNTVTSKKNTTFQETGKTTGWGDAVTSKEQQNFSPLVDILENRYVTPFH